MHEEMRYGIELLAEPTSIGFEEIGIGLENQRDVKQRNPSFLQCLHIVEPKLILDEKRCHKMMAIEPIVGIEGSIGRQIEHFIGQRIVLAHLITRRREERQQNLVLRIVALDGFDDGPPLFKLAQRSRMEPNPVTIVLRQRLFLEKVPSERLQFLHLLAATFNPQLRLSIAKQRRDAHTQGIKQYSYREQYQHVQL